MVAMPLRARLPGLLLAIAAWQADALTWTMREFNKGGFSLIADEPLVVDPVEQHFFDYYPMALADNLASSPTGKLPRMMSHFDWILGLPACQDPIMRTSPWFTGPCEASSAPDHTWKLSPTADPYLKNITDPRTVLTTTWHIRLLMDYAEEHFDPARTDRVLVVMDDFNLTMTSMLLMHTSVEEMVTRIRKYFPAQWWLAKDVDLPGVHTQPIGLASRYMRNGTMAAASAAIAEASIAETYKTRNALAAWGTFNPQFDSDDCGGPMGMPFWNTACDSRGSARKWAASPAGARAGVEVKSFPSTEYWGEVARSRFMLSPLGVGIQTCKPIEALLVLTIPIVQRGVFPAYDDMKQMGFPIVVVDQWEEVTPESMDRWWAELSPKLASFRQNCLTEEAYWKWATGEVTVCS